MEDIRAIADQDTMSELRAIMAAHRDRRKRIQQRHLQNKQKMVTDLMESIPKLRTEAEQLQQQRKVLSTRLAKESVWPVAIECFRVFQHGFPQLEASRADAVDFLTATMAPDLDTGTTSGVEALAERWRVFTQKFPNGHIVLESLRRVANDSVVATTMTRVTFTKQMLQETFPSLRVDKKGKNTRKELVVARLLGQRVAMHGSVRFEWDSSSNRVYSSTDMFSPILQLLGNLEDVSIVFSGAFIAPDRNLGVEEATQQQ
ncbi:hypothetical protein PHYPSEUDO_002955 [Phytophthora pseudosyringae]|uniref:Bzip transcription factor n=1 Tax=Phytophthora pseudosyringae TaxID=221518 RepID=A0A8T1VW18_9STRA|nr:hypothetical protein PHYPSEUDO_002955 [Phytophthora pseudosyringae]